jgi:hypothetical protein
MDTFERFLADFTRIGHKVHDDDALGIGGASLHPTIMRRETRDNGAINKGLNGGRWCRKLVR